MKQLICIWLLVGSSAVAQPNSTVAPGNSEAFYQRYKTALIGQFGRLADEADIRFLLGQIIDRKHLEVDYNQYFRPNPAPLAQLMSNRRGESPDQIKASLIYPLLRFVLPKIMAMPIVSAHSSLGERIAAGAHQYLGIPYGSPTYNRQTGRGTLDCSGLVRYVFDDVGINSRTLSSVATLVQNADLKPMTGEPKPGDLLVRKHGNGRWSHVGIFVGKGQLIEAPYSGTVVCLMPYKSAKWEGILRHVRAYDTRT